MSRPNPGRARTYFAGAILALVAWIAVFALGDGRISYSLPVLSAWLFYRAQRESAPGDQH